MGATILLTVMLFTGTTNADVFFAWLSQDLLPKLPPNSIIVMDNAAFHKRADSQQLIEQAGHLVEFLRRSTGSVAIAERCTTTPA